MPRPSKSAATLQKPLPARIARALLIFLFIFGAAPLLAACSSSSGIALTPEPTATLAPSPVPSPTLLILNSEELYAEDRRHIGETSPLYASLPAGAVLPPVPSGASERGVTVLLDAATVVSGELYQQSVVRQPGILILGADVAAWGDMPRQLAAQGFVVLVLQTGPLTPARQVETMLQSLIALPTVDAGLIGLVGAARAADLAALSCSVNTLCDALALFSPLARDSLLNVLPSLGQRPLWLAAARNDAESLGAAAALANAALGSVQFIQVSEGRGAELLATQPELAEQMVEWFKGQIKENSAQAGAQE